MKKALASLAVALMLCLVGRPALANDDIPGNMIVFNLAAGSVPTVHASPLDLTDLQLERGEVINDILLGDTARWQYETAESGQGIPHVIVRPAVDDNTLRTNIIILTNRRSYNVQLDTLRPDLYMAAVAFTYGEDDDK